MNERVALITGGARGIGREIALTLAQQGWSVALCFRTSAAQAQETCEEVKSRGAKGVAIQCDVSDPEACNHLVAQVQGEWGRIDALINGAGPYHRTPLLKETPQGWQEMFDNNLHPVFYLSSAVTPGMIERKWGRIICFAMATADKISAQPDITAHFIAKTGVLVLTRTLARILAPYQITVNAISPGFIDSGSAPAEELEQMAKKIPAGYIGSTTDAAKVVSFLLSDTAAYINGTNIHLSGGWGL